MNRNNNTHCDPWLELVSAYVDGELSAAESGPLLAHLEVCPSCKEAAAGYRDLDDLVSTSAGFDCDTESTVVHQKPVDLPLKPVAGIRRVFWRIVPLAVAASVLLCIFIFGFRGPGNPGTELSAEEIARPIADLQLLGQHRQNNNDMMLEMLALELRTLRLELKWQERSANVASGDSSAGDSSAGDSGAKTERRLQLNAKVEELESKLNQIKALQAGN